jgi:hypothetical protein
LVNLLEFVPGLLEVGWGCKKIDGKGSKHFPADFLFVKVEAIIGGRSQDRLRGCRIRRFVYKQER